MFMMDPPSAWEMIESGAIPGLCWLTLWLVLSVLAARSERRGLLMASWIACCVIFAWIACLLLSVPALAIGAGWAPFGPLGLGVICVRRLLALRERNVFEW